LPVALTTADHAAVDAASPIADVPFATHEQQSVIVPRKYRAPPSRAAIVILPAFNRPSLSDALSTQRLTHKCPRRSQQC
jgi:hypothetical protein